MSRSRVGVGSAAVALIVVLLLIPGNAGLPAERTLGDSAVRARVGEPRFPEGIAVRGNKMYVSSPAQFLHGDKATVFEFDRDSGKLLNEHPIPVDNPSPTRGLVGMAFGPGGDLYVADTDQGIVRLRFPGGGTEQYGVLPDLHPCVLGTPPACSPTKDGRPPFPNDIVFDAEGNAFVSDSAQAAIFKIPSTGAVPRQAEVWFAHEDLYRPGFGPNGIRFTPDGGKLCIAVTGPPGAIYCVNSSKPETLELLRKYDRVGEECEEANGLCPQSEGPDNMAFGKSGRLYVALAFANKVEVLEAGGRQAAVYAGPAKDGDREIPYSAPAGVAFDNKTQSLVVTNHALIEGLLRPELSVVFDIFVKDVAAPLQPALK